MKNNLIYKYLFVVMAVILITALPAVCAPTEEIKSTAVKFIMAMGGVALSSFIIFAGLTVYNKLFVDKKINFNKEDNLTTPTNIDDAVTFFIKKNKLR